MSRYENKLSTLQARTIIDCIKEKTGYMETRSDIEKNAMKVINFLTETFPEVFHADFTLPKNENPYYSYLAFTFSRCAEYAIEKGSLTVREYIAILASVKEENETSISDFGAFGDLFEVLVRCAFMRKYSLVKWYMLSVKSIEKMDIKSKNFGVIEVGHNGKTLSYGTLFDFMKGDYTSVVYGVFSEEDKKEVYNLCRAEEYEKAIDYITSYSVYWENKYQFQEDMNNLTRGKGITRKGDNIQVVYNAGKYNAFVSAIENGIFTSLFEMLRR